MPEPVVAPARTTTSDEQHVPIRVLMLIKGLGAGGAEKLLCHTMEARDQTDFAYEAAYLLPWKDTLVDDLERAGLPVTCLEGGNEWDLRWAVRLRRRLASDPVDIVHVHSPYVAGIARVVVRSLPRQIRPRFVYTEHLPWSGYVTPTRILNRLTYQLNDVTIHVSEAVRDAVPRRLRQRDRVILHGVPLDRLRRSRARRAEMRERLALGPADIAIGTVANFRPQKRYADLLRAARYVLDAGLQVRFLAAGQGPEEPTIRRLH
jgi:glycosyltransferase involved in cell wall biosynthesis